MRIMYLYAATVLSLGGIIFLFSFLFGSRRKLIDQMESDIKIFFTFLLLLSFYFQFLCIIIIYSISLLLEYDIHYVITLVYFLIPLLLAILLYLFLPHIFTKSLQLQEISLPKQVKEAIHILGIPEFNRVYTTPSTISPFVFGRRNKSAILVLPYSFNTFFSEKEQKAVIVHELSHVKQKDVGFFTWLTLLTEGLKYWLIPLPLLLYYDLTSFFLYSPYKFISYGLIIVCFGSLLLLRNSLSRTREYIADAYAVFHGFDEPLKSALYKYAAVETLKKGWSSSLQFFTKPKIMANRLSWMRTHPPLENRLNAIDDREFLREYQKNLSPHLAYWTGLISAFLYYNSLVSLLGFSFLIQLIFPLSDETIASLFHVSGFLIIMITIGISYIFPSTKGVVSFSDFKEKSFIIPLLRNWSITLATGGIIFMVLFFDIVPLKIYVYAAIVGFIIWFIGFSSSLASYGVRNSHYFVFSPIFPVLMFWYPVQAVYAFIFNSDVHLNYCIGSMALIMIVSLIFLLIFLERGYLNVDVELHLLKFLGKKIEIHQNKWIFAPVSIIVLCSLPSLLAFFVYVLSCYVDSLHLLFQMSTFVMVIPPLVLYSFTRADILFFTEVLFYIDLAHDKITGIDKNFIANVIHRYHSTDGGFDCFGLDFSNGRDTYGCIKAAIQLHIPMNRKKVEKWFDSIKSKDGFSIISGGDPRIEGTFYALHSLHLLNEKEKIPENLSTWLLECYNGHFFEWKNDACSPLLQTCYAIESLFLLDKLPATLDCSPWIRKWFTQNLDAKETFFAVRSLKLLNSSIELGYQWLEKNKAILETRIDKNTQIVYYYVRMLQELEEEIPSFIREDALTNIGRKREKYGKRFSGKH